MDSAEERPDSRGNFGRVEDFVWWLRELDFKKKFLLALGFLVLLFCIFWFRPMPKEILENQKYADISHNTRFAEGACRFYDDVVVTIDENGKKELKSREHFLSQYRAVFEQDNKRGSLSQRRTLHLKYRWNGIYRLVQVVDFLHLRTMADKSRRAQTRKLALHWKKTERGWRVYEIRVLPH